MQRQLYHVLFITLLIFTMLPIVAEAEAEKDWSFEVGGGAVVAPVYEGSDKYRVIPIPDISVSYKNGLFFANIWDGIGSYPIQIENFKAGVALGFTLGRDEDDDRTNLRGMGDIEPELLANLLAEYDFGLVQLGSKVSIGTDEYGVTATVNLGTRHSITEKVMLVGTINAVWADEKHMRSYFGISSSQSSRSGYSRYSAESGIKSVGVSAGAVYSITNNWTAKLIFMGDQLVGDAADSPLVKEEFQPSVVTSLGYKF